jgi:hypothetical protein
MQYWVLDNKKVIDKIVGVAEFQCLSTQDFKAPDVPFGDGVGSDNLAIYPLLRRACVRLLRIAATQCRHVCVWHASMPGDGPQTNNKGFQTNDELSRVAEEARGCLSSCVVPTIPSLHPHKPLLSWKRQPALADTLSMTGNAWSSWWL